MAYSGRAKRPLKKFAQAPSGQATDLEQILGVVLPASYKRFLEERGSAIVNGLPLLGLPIGPDIDSAWGATELLRGSRPDLARELVVIRLLESRAFCLDLRALPTHDAPLVEVSLDGDDEPEKVHESFERYVAQADRSQRQIEGAFRRVRWHLNQSRNNYEHTADGRRLPFRPLDWRVLRSCVHDVVVGLLAIRHNENFGGLEVDVFICTDHPDYETGHGVRALTLLLLSDAYRNAGSLEIRFTRYDGRAKTRVPDRIPSAIIDLAREHEIELAGGADGIIPHNDGVRLYAAVVGLDANVADRIQVLEKQKVISLESACYLLGSRIWTREEASWILLNHPRPQGLLLGEDCPEDRFKYVESLTYGRAAIAASSLREKLSPSDRGLDGDCNLRVSGPSFVFSPARESVLDWSLDGTSRAVEAGDALTVLPRPSPIMPDQGKRIIDDARYLAAHRKSEGWHCLLYSQELLDTDGLEEYVAAASEEFSIDTLVMPSLCRDLDEVVQLRLSQGRALVR